MNRVFLSFVAFFNLLIAKGEHGNNSIRGEVVKMAVRKNRLDLDGTHQSQYRSNKKKIYATQNVCGICGRPVDFNLKYPHPLSPSIDHIIPIAKGGHPSDISNLQLAHWECNRQKSDKLFANPKQQIERVTNRDLPQSMDWVAYRGERSE